MQNLFNTIDTLDWTPEILFGVALFGIISLIQSLDKQSKNKFIQLEGKIVHNNYDPTGFRFLFAWFLFAVVVIFYVLYKTYAK